VRDETRKRLERAIWLERAKKASLGLLGVAVVGGFIAYQNLDLKIENTQVAGIVDGIDSFVTQTRNGDGVYVGVKLGDGRHVKVIALKSRVPHIGDQVTVVEQHHGTGRVTLTMK
jgi:hypothetical protein